MTVVDFKNITVRYDQEDVLHNINLRIEAKEHYAILGANGSGKSTLIKLFSNDLHPVFSNDNKKEIFGKSNWNIWELKSHLGLITGDLHLRFLQYAKDQTGFDVVASGFYNSIGRLNHQHYTAEQLAKVKETMSFIGIEHLSEKIFTQMSTGEMKKCVIARALLHKPLALLLDEPSSGLDMKARFDFVEMLQKISENTTIILITHHIEEIFPQIQKIALLKNGVIFRDGKKEKILTEENLSATFNMSLQIYQRNGFYYAQKK